MPYREILRRIKNPSERVIRQQRRYDILNDAVEGHIRNFVATITNDSQKYHNIIAHLDLSNNCYRAIISLCSQVYKLPVQFIFADDNDRLNWSRLVGAKLDAVLPELNLISSALNECFLLVGQKNDLPVFKIIPPHMAEATGDGNDIEEIIYRTRQGYCFFGAGKEITLTADGIKITEKDCPIIPVIMYRSVLPVDDFFANVRGEDLVHLYLDQVVCRSGLNQGLRLQSFKQLAREPVTDFSSPDMSMSVRQDVHTGPQEILEGKYSVLDFQTNLQIYQQVIDAKLIRAATNYGISPSMLNAQSHTSGLERELSSAGLQEIRAASIVKFRLADVALAKLVTVLFPGFSQSPEVTIDYASVEIYQTEQDKLTALQMGMTLGVASPAEYVLQNNPDLATIEAAQAVVDLYLESSARTLESRMKFMALIDNGKNGNENENEK